MKSTHAILDPPPTIEVITLGVIPDSVQSCAQAQPNGIYCLYRIL